MESWPGPSQLLRFWEGGGLNESDQVSLLLGGAAFHDPVLLPAYRDAVISPSARVRQAAVYGYRDLLGDSVPDVSVGISSEAANLLADEMEFMMQTVAQSSLLAVWLQALLDSEETGLPGWEGIILQRPPSVCLKAVGRLADAEDLNLLLVAYDLSGDFGTRVNLLKLVESVTLSRFIIVPDGGQKGWGRHVFETAMGGLEGARRTWTQNSCVVNVEDVLARNLAAMGVSGIDPLAADGCGVWLGVLDQGIPQWWSMAARRLYECGGPWHEISALSPEREPGPSRRKQLLEWYQPLMPKGRRPEARR